MAAAAESIARYYRFFQKKSVSRVLDYGAGTLRNSAFLAEQGFSVYAADLPEQVERIMGLSASEQLAGVLGVQELERAGLGVDLVVSTYVLNIVPDGVEKSSYLKNIAVNLRPDGYLLIEVRCRTEALECGSTCSHHMKCPNCVKTYSHDELDQLLGPYGFKRICHYYRRHALSLIYQLLND